MMSTMRLFFHSIDRDIESLEQLKASASILDKLRSMQDSVRSQWAKIYSNDKHEVANSISAYFDLNIEVNEVYNKIVTERSDYLLDNNIDDLEPVDEYILEELFLSYTIFLDAYSECNFYYVICGNFPFHSMGFFANQKMMRAANRAIEEKDGE